MSSKKKELLSSAMKRTSEWISSQEVPSDVNIHIGDASFSLHKFPLSSKCGYLKKLISESNDSDVCNVEIHDIPGGSEAFELAAKFCYGFNFELSTENIAMLRCVAEYLEMTEDYAVGNLVGRTESYLNEVALKSLSSCVSILVTSENLLPMAEQVKLVSRCVDAIAILACKDSQFSGSNKIEGESEGGNSSLGPQQKAIAEFWWAEDLTMLRIDMFHRVMIAMTARGFKQYALGPLLMLYAQKSLRGLEMISKGRKKLEPKQEHEKRVVLETIVSLLPRERNVLSVSFLAMLLRSSTWLETTVACRLDLEKRMALQLGQAALDDLLIPSYCITGDTLFDVDSVRRILMNYLESEVEGNHLGYGVGEEHVSPSNDLERVGKLMENYLAEIASDRNLTVSKFIGLVELIPEQARVTDDGIYRAIDIFLKAHPTLSDLERKKVCSVMDCQKLSREACAHAAQNDRLPVQTVVQVLYHEQQRLRDNMNETNGGESNSSTGAIVPSKTLNLYPTSTPSTEELLKLRRENEDLKIELLKLNMRLKEVDKRMNLIDNANNYNNNININTSTSATNSPANSFAPSVTAGAADGDQKPPLPRKSFMNSVKKLGRLLLLADGVLTPSTRRTKSNKGRRHSIS